MNYCEAREYISSLSQYGIIPGLSGIRRLLEALGEPQKGLSVIQIAGTNGKGSVGAFLESALLEAGYCTGRFVSPAVFDPCEIYRINGRPVLKEQYASVITEAAEAAERLAKAYPHVSPFELETAGAYLCFAREGCDIVLIETGMGGRTDSTNVTERNVMSVLTPIAMDHTAFLGNTIEEIARQKAGIIKEGGICVSAVQEPAVRAVLAAEARCKQAVFQECGRPEIVERSLDGIRINLKGLPDLRLSVCGDYQAENASLAAEATFLLAEHGFPITEEQIRRGFFKASWPGRFQLLPGDPPILLDGAHNPHGIRALAESLQRYCAGRSMAAVTGVFRDKEYEKMAEGMAPLFRRIDTVKPEGARGLEAETWAEALRRYQPNTNAHDSVLEAVDAACTSGCDLVVCFGSLSFLNQVCQYNQKKFTGKEPNNL